MKKIKLLVLVLVCLFVINVKADMGPPMIVSHKVMVTNKDGAACYGYDRSGKYTKTGKVIPYKTTLNVDSDISGNYITVYDASSHNSCDVKYSDVSAIDQKFDFNNEQVVKIDDVKAVILAKGGLNMRKGPSVTYSKVVTVPEHAVVTLTHRAGDYWYYCEYNGKSGWITGMNGYFGYEGKEVLINYEPVKIYSSMDRKKEIGKIPANTEITNYLNLVSRSQYEISHYVIYNGLKGYIDKMMYKTDGTGKIKLIKDFEVANEFGELIKKLTANQELEYTMSDGSNTFYFINKKLEAYVPKDYYEVVNNANSLIKKEGYIGEGLFGEEKMEVVITPEPANDEKKEDSNKEKGMSTRDIIIICLLGGIFLSLTAIVIIKLVNGKKNKKIDNVSKDINKTISEEKE